MELLLKRPRSSDEATVSPLTQNGQHVCWICEDVVREQYIDGEWTWNKGMKVAGKTAIPSGRYQIVINHSNRFNKDMPLLLNVPDFSGVRIHPGNTHADTEACLLPGSRPFNNDDDPEFDAVADSRLAYDKLFNMIKAEINSGDAVFITIINDWIP